eukprot:g28077.t1
MSQIPNVVFKLKAYSGTFLHRSTTLEDGDKIVLHQSILDQVMTKFKQRSLPHPMVWELRNTSVGKISHCGVLEFSAPDKDHAFLPKWMMENMFLEDGSPLQIKLKPLPKATSLKLQPKETDFLTLPDPKSSLEYCLRKFTAVTKGDTIMVKHGKKHYHFAVLEVQPDKFSPPAVCVIDTKVSVEFQLDEKLAAKMQAENAAGTSTGLNPSNLNPSKFQTFDLENPAEGHLAADELIYFRFKIVDVHMALEFRLEHRAGPDQAPGGELYVSAATEPGPATYTWTTRGQQEHTILIEPEHTDFSKSWYFLALEAGSEGCDYRLKAREVYPQNLGTAIPGTEAGSPGTSGAELGRNSLGGPQADAKLCDNCKCYIPNKQYTMHTMRCARLNVRCERCKVAILRTQQATHIHCPREGCNIILRSDKEVEVHLSRQHTRVACNCGEDVAPGALALHQAEHCSLRIVACKYCSLKLPFLDQEEHMSYCGSKSSNCPVCDQPFAAKRMATHLAVSHNYNPSLRPDQPGYKSIAMLRHELRQRGKAKGHTDKLFDLPADYAARAGKSRRADAIIGREHVETEAEEEEAELRRAIAASQSDNSALEDQLLAQAIAESKATSPDAMVDDTPGSSPPADGPSPMLTSPEESHTSRGSSRNNKSSFTSSSSSSSFPAKAPAPAPAKVPERPPPPAASPATFSNTCLKCPGMTFPDYNALIDHEMDVHS